MLENFYCKELNCLNYYETLALKIKNKLEDLRNLQYFMNFQKLEYLHLEINNLY